MKRILCLTLGFYLLSLLTAAAQPAGKKALDHDDVDRWKTVQSPAISPDGRWVVYELQPGQGDPELHLYDGQQKTTWRYARGAGGRLSADSRYLVFTIKPPQDSVKAMRRRKVKKDDLPRDTLGIYDLRTGTLSRVAGLRNFRLPEKWAGWLAYQLESLPADTARTGKGGAKKDDKAFPLILRQLASGRQDTVPAVTQYTLAEEGPRVLLARSGEAPGVYIFNGDTPGLRPLLRARGKYEQLALDKSGGRAAFLADLDTTRARIRPFALYGWTGGPDSARLVAPATGGGLAADWRISENGRLTFADDGARLFFGVAPAPILEDTTLLEEEIVKVEVWSHADPDLYTQQEARLEQEKKRTYAAVWHINEGKIVQLADETLPEVRPGNEGMAPLALGYDEGPYRQQVAWRGYPTCKDVFLVNLMTGQRKQIASGVCGNPALSPQGKFAYWYSQPDSAWYVYRIERDELRRVTDHTVAPFYDELNDVPDYPGAYGLAGWTTQDDFVLIYDRYDLWLIDPTGKMPPNNLTRGRAEKKRYRYIRLDPDERAIEEVKPMLLHVFNETSKEEGYAWLDVHTGFGPALSSGPFSYDSRVLKARNAERYVFTRENFQVFPDLLYSTDLRQFTRISDANPQQGNFRWGSIELVEWTSLDGQRLQGLLVKPEGFDPAKKYPLIVNFYERSTDGLHQHRTPSHGRSTINYPFYASRGYLIFNPDVPYRIGYPGESALNAVVSGVTSLVDRGFVDRDRMALQGHSWGGYQIAYLLTRTDMFRCAEAGAPVVNMISAYGGIRWESGMSRQFQYERTQSRIGGALWEYPLRFIENSPIFTADKINTPVLILHNDEDGAVPWYQGIEFFTALRRLGKPAWLLNYNGEPHWPVKFQNRRDFQQRLQQFFDHYLRNAPRPVWMERGVPAIEKGIRQGLEPAASTDQR